MFLLTGNRFASVNCVHILKSYLFSRLLYSPLLMCSLRLPSASLLLHAGNIMLDGLVHASTWLNPGLGLLNEGRIWIRGSAAHLGVLTAGHHLPEEGDGLLAQLLRVSDVAHDDLLERELLPGLELRRDFLCQLNDLSAYCRKSRTLIQGCE